MVCSVLKIFLIKGIELFLFNIKNKNYVIISAEVSNFLLKFGSNGSLVRKSY